MNSLRSRFRLLRGRNFILFLREILVFCSLQKFFICILHVSPSSCRDIKMCVRSLLNLLHILLLIGRPGPQMFKYYNYPIMLPSFAFYIQLISKSSTDDEILFTLIPPNDSTATRVIRKKRRSKEKKFKFLNCMILIA